MKNGVILIFLFSIIACHQSQETSTDSPDTAALIEPVLQPLAFGSIQPAGWLKEEMQRNLKGFTGHIDSFFTIKALNPNKHLGQEAMIGQYAHGNEPSHHIAYLYAFSHSPEKGRKLITQICDQFYNDSPAGMIGNDDCGQMSAWYIFATLGFYPVNPSKGEFILGIPQVRKAAVKLANQKKLIILNEYKKGEMMADFDKATLPSCIITFNRLKNGGTLRFKSK